MKDASIKKHVEYKVEITLTEYELSLLRQAMKQPILPHRPYDCAQTGQQVEPQEETSAYRFREKMQKLLEDGTTPAELS